MTLYVASIVFSWHYNLPVLLGNQGCLQFMPLAPKLLLFMSPWCQSLYFNHFTQGYRVGSISNTRTSSLLSIDSYIRWFLHKTLDLGGTSPEHHQVSGYFILKFILLEIKE